jgi:rRNA maturation endonuclease Nob1
MDTITAQKKVPSDQDIAEVENRLNEMRAAREEARKTIISTLRSPEMLSALSNEDAVVIMKALQMKLRGNRKRQRGSPVDGAVKNRLEQALVEQDFTLAQLSKMFNLSVSYISRVKRALKQAKGPVLNAYEDHPLKHSAVPHAGEGKAA